MPARIKIEEKWAYTVYSFRGPKSHRPVEVEVFHPFVMVGREALALKRANENFLNSWVSKAMQIGRKHEGTAETK